MTGDVPGSAAALSVLSRRLWCAGRSEDAATAGRQAAELLETQPAGPELALAYTNVSMTALNVEDRDEAELVEAVLSHISDALVAGEAVKISSFGTFSVREKAARVGRNPKTGEEVPIHPRRVLTFRSSHLMKDRVAAGNKG